jgi:hypothetical protein
MWINTPPKKKKKEKKRKETTTTERYSTFCPLRVRNL